MKFVSWNVNGLRACMKKGFEEYFMQEDADIFCLQETKLQEGQIDWKPEGYHCFWNYAVKKGYSGTAIFTKQKPDQVFYGMEIEEHDQEGRVITLEFDKYYFVTVYTPNSQNELARLAYRMRWEEDFLNYINRLDRETGKPVIVCGDLNVAASPIDLKNPKANEKSAGYTIQEREAFGRLLRSGYVDSYRCLYPDKVEYSWWSYRFKARERNAGWRIDYFLLSERLKEQIKEAAIRTEVQGSDHCPVVLELL